MKFKKLMLLVIIPVMLAGCSANENAGKPDTGEAREAMKVKTTLVELAKTPDVYRAVGTVTSGKSSVISPRVMGNVEDVLVAEGQQVEKGRLLVVIDAREIESRVRQAEAGIEEARQGIEEIDEGIAAAEAGLESARAGLELAKKTFDRYENLKEKNSVSKQEYDQALAKKKMAESGVEGAEKSLGALQAKRKQIESRMVQAGESKKQAELMRSYSKITAPFDGVITRKMVEPGQLASPGTPLLSIEDYEDYRLEVQVDESFVQKVVIGTEVDVMLDALKGEIIKGRVVETVPTVDSASRKFVVKISLPYVEGIRSGMYGQARCHRGDIEVLRIPAAAVVARGQLTGVYSVKDGAASFRLIKTGRELDGGMIEVLSGLSAGEEIIVTEPHLIEDGMRVEVEK